MLRLARGQPRPDRGAARPPLLQGWARSLPSGGPEIRAAWSMVSVASKSATSLPCWPADPQRKRASTTQSALEAATTPIVATQQRLVTTIAKGLMTNDGLTEPFSDSAGAPRGAWSRPQRAGPVPVGRISQNRGPNWRGRCGSWPPSAGLSSRHSTRVGTLSGALSGRSARPRWSCRPSPVPLGVGHHRLSSMRVRRSCGLRPSIQRGVFVEFCGCVGRHVGGPDGAAAGSR
jgi:hypothetical protein